MALAPKVLQIPQGTQLQLAGVRQQLRQRFSAFAALATAQPSRAQSPSSAEAMQPAPATETLELMLYCGHWLGSGNLNGITRTLRCTYGWR